MGSRRSPLTRMVQPESWTQDAACRGMDPELFFPGRGESVQNAVAVCSGCVVRAECLDYAIREQEETGVWGGLSGNQRKNLKGEAPSSDPTPGTTTPTRFVPAGS